MLSGKPPMLAFEGINPNDIINQSVVMVLIELQLMCTDKKRNGEIEGLWDIEVDRLPLMWWMGGINVGIY